MMQNSSGKNMAVFKKYVNKRLETLRFEFWRTHITICQDIMWCSLEKKAKVLENSKFLEYRVVDKSLARPGRKQATATEDSDIHIFYLLS